MLQDLPLDCLRLIVGHLPTASSILNLALTSRHFYSQISADDYAILRDFVQNAFPSIRVAPPWRKVAVRLTSRSRAWDRRAFIARECWNPSTDWIKLSSASKHGFVPVVDSYEMSSVDSYAPGKEVLAHSAAGRVMIRVNRAGSCGWRELSFHDDHRPENDILDLHLLRPHQHSGFVGETVVFRRANGEVMKVESPEDPDSHPKHTEYSVPESSVDCTAVSNDRNPLMAACVSNAVHLYHVPSEGDKVHSTASFQLKDPPGIQSKTRCTRFLSGSILAAGRDWASIQIYDLNALPPRHGTHEPLHSLTDYTEDSRIYHRPNTLAPLDNTSGNTSNLLLSGWTDGVARLYDIRTPHGKAATYYDTVDDGQILSLLPIGHERFLAGSHQNACLKTFDLRMPGARPYSYRNAAQCPRLSPKLKPSTSIDSLVTDIQRGINIFLAPPVNMWSRVWIPILRLRPNQSERYRGPIYSLSSPSSSSPTVYAGITNHVIQLDFVSTDDIFTANTNDPMLRISRDHRQGILDLSCYERPRPDHSSTDAILLRKQKPWKHVVDRMMKHERPIEAEEGWDERWNPPASRNDGRWARGQRLESFSYSNRGLR